MKVICVDDERLLMEDTLAMCLSLPEIDEAKGFVWARDALEWTEHNPVDLALLDIDMPDMNGIMLAAEIKNRSPGTAIIFLTGYAQYAVDAFAVRASGYLLILLASGHAVVTREAEDGGGPCVGQDLRPV